jgi:hypothetical protein
VPSYKHHTRSWEHTDAGLRAVRIIHDVWDKHP